LFIETVHTAGIASLSYVVGDDHGAVVIDPRRDVDTYLDIAHGRGARIRYVLETHRHEDFVEGASTLAERTGATILHGASPELLLGAAIAEGATLRIGPEARLVAIETPGHTPESLSYALYHGDDGTSPVGVFTGDTLFVGAVGRTDLLPGHERELAEQLYESLHHKLLPLGDGCIVWPAHGAGSVCGHGMADRDVSTIGYERHHNPMLQHRDEASFVAAKLAERQEIPPYFHRMEEVNRVGARPMSHLPEPLPVSVEGLTARLSETVPAVVLDVRAPQCFAASHVPGSLAIPLSLLPAYAGWFLPYDVPITLVADGPAAVREAVLHLTRLGYEGIEGWLEDGITAWEQAGREIGHVPPIQAGELKRRIDNGDVTLLDVRSHAEWDVERVDGARHVFLGHLPERLDHEPLPRDYPIVTFCGSGHRAIIAASILLDRGYSDVLNSFGSMSACRAVGCPMEPRA